jgi:hypothetical protein
MAALTGTPKFCCERPDGEVCEFSSCCTGMYPWSYKWVQYLSVCERILSLTASKSLCFQHMIHPPAPQSMILMSQDSQNDVPFRLRSYSLYHLMVKELQRKNVQVWVRINLSESFRYQNIFAVTFILLLTI